MAGNIIVIIVVCLAAFFVGKRIYKIYSGRQVDCGCDSQAGCPAPCDVNQNSESKLKA